MSKVSGLLILVLIAFASLAAMLSFMGELSQTYSLNVPANLSTKTEEYTRTLNSTAQEFIETASNEESWIETAFNIFFRYPASIYNTMSTSVSTVNSFFGVMIAESGTVVPSWLIIVIGTGLAITFAFTAIYFIFGRRI